MRPLLLAVLLVVGALSAQAKIHNIKVVQDDRSLIPMTEAFGFGPTGQLIISISNVAISWKDDQQQKLFNRFGFFLSPEDSDIAMEQDLLEGNQCIEDKDYIFNFKDSQMQALLNNEAGVTNFTLKRAIDPTQAGLAYLYFANCERIPVSFDLYVEMYNLNSNGDKDYLSIGESQLDLVYWVMFALFTSMTGLWGWYVWKNRQHAHKIHYLMGALVFFKSMTLMSQGLMVHYVETTGFADGWNIAYYILTFCRGVLFFTVVVLVGTGWSYMKPFLGDKEKRILMVVIPLQVFANIAIIITQEESPAVKDWFTWRDVFHLVDIICCCAILFPIVWSIKHLREASQTDGKAARSLEKLTLFRQFYVMVVVYIYFTRIVVYLIQSTTQYQYLSEAADQLATLAFYVWTAVKFRPQQTNPYLTLPTSEVELS